MATVTFNNQTLWDDSGTGIGRPEVVEMGAHALLTFEPVVRGRGLIAKDLGTIPEAVQVFLTYRMDGTAYAALRSTLNGQFGNVGTLAWPPSQSLTQCMITGHQRVRTGRVGVTEGGSVIYEIVQAIFIQRIAV